MINKIKALAILIVLITSSLTVFSGPEDNDKLNQAQNQKQPSDIPPHTVITMLQIYSIYIEQETTKRIPDYHQELLPVSLDGLNNPQLLKPNQQGAYAELQFSYSKIQKVKAAIDAFENFYYGQYTSVQGPQRLSPSTLRSVQQNLEWFLDFIKILNKRKFVGAFMSSSQINDMEILALRIETLKARTSLEILNIWRGNPEPHVRAQLFRETDSTFQNRNGIQFGEMKFPHMYTWEQAIEKLNYIVPRLSRLKNGSSAQCLSLFF
jgi:hypothetical protein